MKKILVLSLCFGLVGCATAKTREVEQFNIPVDYNKVSYRIAYQDDKIALPIDAGYHDLNKKVNICITDIYFKEKKVTRPSDEYNWYVYPSWSPNGSKLAFAGITCKSLKEPYVYDVGIFVCNENGNDIMKIFSSVDVSNPFYTFFENHLTWTNDNKTILIPSSTNSKGYKWILVSINDGEILKQGDYDEIKRSLFFKKVELIDYVPFRRDSPDGKWEIYRTRLKTFLLNPIDIFFRKDFYGSIEANPTFPYIQFKPATYIKSKESIWKRMIRPSGNCYAQFTPDSKYVVGYDFLSNKAFIVNLKGEVVFFEGENTRIQHKLK